MKKNSKQTKSMKNHGRRRKSGQHSASHKSINGNKAKTMKLFRSAAKQGDAEAMFKLGLGLLQKNGSEHDTAEGKKWLEKSAELGFPSAITVLGMYSLNGLFGYRKDVDKSLALFKDAYQKGDVAAALSLGMIYLGGFEVFRDIHQAVKYLSFAAENGAPIACFQLGNLYAHGIGVRKDKAESARLLLMAAKGGHEEAKRALGMV
jgi:TPR repeat protein